MSASLWPVAILAGGLGQRLGELTKLQPKALVDVNGEPFIAHQLRLLRANGAQRVVLCVGFLGDAIREVVGDGGAYGVSVEYSCDGPRLLGTGGAIKNALPLLGDNFLVMYGDSYLTCDYREVQAAFLQESNKLGLMTVLRNDGQWDQSNVEFVDGAIRAYDKKTPNQRMRHVDYGLGVFSAAAFDGVPPDEPHDLASVYQRLVTSNQLTAFEVSERFYEVGSLIGLAETRAHLAQRELEALKQTLIELQQLSDALRDRAEAASARETELCAMLVQAREELQRHVETIDELRGISSNPREMSLLEERTRWAQRATADVAERDQTIHQLQTALAEQSAWAQRSAAEVAHRDAIIRNLQASARVSGVLIERLTLLKRVLPGKLRSLITEHRAI